MPVRNRITRLIAVLGLVVSLALLLLGIGRFFWWKPANFLTITSSKPQVPMVVTGINVLESTAETVTITASASGKTPVFLGVALTSDVQAFVMGQKYLELTGFASSSAFVEKTVLPSTKTPTQSSTPAPSASATKGTTKDTTKDAAATGIQALAAPPQKDAADLATLDIWKKTATGNGKASLNWSLSDARWSAVAFTDGTKPAPTLALKWQQQTSSVASWLLTVLGLLGSVIFGVYLVLSLISEKRSHASRHTAMEQARARRIAARVTGTLPEAAPPAVQGRPTRRQLRAMAQGGGAVPRWDSKTARLEVPARLEDGASVGGGEVAGAGDAGSGSAGTAAPAATETADISRVLPGQTASCAAQTGQLPRVATGDEDTGRAPTHLAADETGPIPQVPPSRKSRRANFEAPGRWGQIARQNAAQNARNHRTNGGKNA